MIAIFHKKLRANNINIGLTALIIFFLAMLYVSVGIGLIISGLIMQNPKILKYGFGIELSCISIFFATLTILWLNDN